MINTWTALWSSIVESSIMEEDDSVFKVFIAMLAIKGPDHIVRANAYQIGNKCGRKPEVEVIRCLKVLASPDKKRIEPQEHEGRRIQKVDGGWLVLNGQKYQDMMQDMIRLRQQAQWQKEQRMIERSIRTGVPLNPEELTPALKKRYDRAKAKGLKAVQKAVDRAGEVQGRTEGVNAALNGGTSDSDVDLHGTEKSHDDDQPSRAGAA